MPFFSFTLLILALAFPRPVACDESLNDYTTRVQTIVSATALETNSLNEAAAVLVLFYAESTFRLDVHSGARLGDSGKARCLGQLHPHVPGWNELAGTDLEATRRCAAQTIRFLRMGMRDCAPRGADDTTRIAHAFAYYGAGHCVEPGRESKVRAKQWAKLLAKVDDAEAL